MRRELEGFAPRSGMLLARGGNHIVQDIGGGNCALCAHLRTGSITVESDDLLSPVRSSGNSELWPYIRTASAP